MGLRAQPLNIAKKWLSHCSSPHVAALCLLTVAAAVFALVANEVGSGPEGGQGGVRN